LEAAARQSGSVKNCAFSANNPSLAPTDKKDAFENYVIYWRRSDWTSPAGAEVIDHAAVNGGIISNGPGVDWIIIIYKNAVKYCCRRGHHGISPFATKVCRYDAVVSSSESFQIP
jgi:hypothetical protein